jgi:drug/metabolite transporter (DMT)-like permease
MSSLRFGIAGLLLYVVARRAGAPAPGLRGWVGAAIAGFALLVLGNAGVAWSELRVGSGIAALLVATTPLWMVLIDRFASGVRLHAGVIGGLLVGLVGVGLLVAPSGAGGIDLVGGLAVLGCSIAWAAGSIFARGDRVPSHPLLAAGAQMLVASVVLAAAGAATGELHHIAAPSTGPVLAFAYLVVVGSIVAYSAYAWLLRSGAPTALVSTYAYANPVIAVLLGWAALGEPLTARTLVAGAAIVGSVVLIVTARSRQTVGADLPETAPGRVGRLVLDRPLQRPAPTLQDLRRAA